MGTTDQLVHRAKQGDLASYERLFERVSTRLLIYIELRLGAALRERLEAADILQEAYVEAHRSFRDFVPQGKAAFLRWMYRVVDHRILDEVARLGARKRRGALLDAPSIVDRLRSPLTGPATLAVRVEERGLLLEAMGGLDEQSRQLLLLRYFKGQSAEEIAEALGKSPRHVRRLLRDAEAALGLAVRPLRGQGGTSEDPGALAVDLLDRCASLVNPGVAAPLRLGRYDVVQELGRGGLGIVFQARDPDTGANVAVKLLSVLGTDARRRFAREALALKRLCHPNIVGIRDVGEHEGAPFLVLDLLGGQGLDARIREQGALPVADAVRGAAQLARALAHAHAQGILHRDVKPSNVIVSGDRFVLADFGLAKLIDADLSQLSEHGHQLGTEGYWPPEQARGDLARIGPASDVYALGATLYAMLTGSAPVGGATRVERLRATLKGQITPASARRPEVTGDLDALCSRCLHRDPAQRFLDGAALSAALEALQVSGG